MAQRRRRHDVLGLDLALGAARVETFDRPHLFPFVPVAGRNARSHLDAAAHFHNFFGARFPHHARPETRVAESIDQGFDDFAALFRFSFRQQSVFDGRRQRKAFDALRRPVGGDVLAVHAPDLFGVGFEEDREKPLAELIAHPVFKIFRVFGRHQARFAVGSHAERGIEHAELEQSFEGFERIGKKLAAIENARRAGPVEHVVRQNFRPEILDFLRFREKAVTADIEAKIFVFDRSGNAADVFRVGFEHRHLDRLILF